MAVLSPGVTFFICLPAFRKFSKTARILFLLVFFAMVSEAAAYYTAYYYRTNHLVYSIYDLFDFCLLCLYFNYSIRRLKKGNWGIVVAVTGAVICFINAFFIEPSNALKLNFTMFSTIVITILCFFSLYQIMVKQTGNRYRQNQDFWFTATIMFYKLSDFLFWGFFSIFKIVVDPVLQATHACVTTFFYISLDIIFLRFLPQKRHEQ